MGDSAPSERGHRTRLSGSWYLSLLRLVTDDRHEPEGPLDFCTYFLKVTRSFTCGGLQDLHDSHAMSEDAGAFILNLFNESVPLVATLS